MKGRTLPARLPDYLWIGLLALFASARLGRAFWRLLLDSGPSAAIDLKLRHEETLLWFSGGDVYALPRLTYPPGAYALLSPFLGWTGVQAARWLWAGLTLVLCLVLVAIVWSETGTIGAVPRARRALVVLALAPISVTIGNGQVGLAVLVALLAATSLARKGGRARTGPVALLLAVALAKPTLSLPFLWLFTAMGTWGSLFGGLVLALLLTLGAASFRAEPLVHLIRCWLDQSRLSFQDPGYANLNSLLSSSLPETWNGMLSLLLILGAGLWVLRHRRADPWVLAGLLGIVARLWTYHRIYDDLLLVPALIALWREAGRSGQWGRITLVLSLASLLAPGALRLLPEPWGLTWELWQTAVWLNLLLLLGALSRRPLLQSRAASLPAREPG